jgi:hypothetical protein
LVTLGRPDPSACITAMAPDWVLWAISPRRAAAAAARPQDGPHARLVGTDGTYHELRAIGWR